MAASGLKMCRHCGVRPVNRPCGLCWRDYYTPGVRALYPSASRYSAAPEVRVANWPRCPQCGLPRAVSTSEDRGHVCETCSRPEPMRAGFFERIALYAARAAAGQPIFG